MHEPFLNPSPYPDTHVPSTYIHSPLHTNIRTYPLTRIKGEWEAVREEGDERMGIIGREGEKMGDEWGWMEGRRTENGEEEKEGKKERRKG